MGGGHRYPYPKWVWTPSGGWWPNPKNANRNGLIYAGFMSVVCFLAVRHCEPRTVSTASGGKVLITRFILISSSKLRNLFLIQLLLPSAFQTAYYPKLLNQDAPDSHGSHGGHH